MKIHRLAFNTYLFGAMALAIVLTGCATGGKKKDPAVAMRFHLEGDAGTLDRTIAVTVLRSSPMRLKIDGDPFLDESFIKHASVVDTIGGFDIRIEVDEQGTWIVQNITAANRGRRMAVFCDFGEKRWLAAHMMDHVVTDGVLSFAADASREEAEQIVDGLNKTADKERRRGKTW